MLLCVVLLTRSILALKPLSELEQLGVEKELVRVFGSWINILPDVVVIVGMILELHEPVGPILGSCEHDARCGERVGVLHGARKSKVLIVWCSNKMK